MTGLTQLHDTGRAYGVAQRLQIGEVLVRGVDRPHGHGVGLKPYLQ